MAKNNKSINDVVCDYIKKQKLSPIPVQTLNEEAETTRYFGGDLKEFIAAAKTLGAKGIFVETLYLEEDEFYYDSGMDDEEYMALYGNDDCCDGQCKCGKCEGKKSKKSKEDDDSDVDGVWFEPEDLDGLDLTLLKPQMAKYLDRVGEACGVRLTVPGVDHLEVEIFADWYDDFAELVDEASEAIEIDPTDALKQAQAIFEAEEAELAKAEDKSVKKIAVHPPKGGKKASKKK
jgi:hypothetical protein